MKKVKSLSYIFVQLAGDLLLVNGSLYLAFLLRLTLSGGGEDAVISFSPAFFLAIPVISVAYALLFFVTGLHRVYWPFSTAWDVLRVVASAFLSTVAVFAVGLLTDNRMPRLVYVLAGLLMAWLLLAFRLFLRKRGKQRSPREVSADTEGRILIVGAGETGNYLLHEFRSNPAYTGAKVICLVDDDPFKRGKLVYSVPVEGGTEEIPALVKKHEIELIIFAISRCPVERRAEILSVCMKTGCRVRSVPSFSKLIDGKVSVSSVQNVRIEDLLGREPIRINPVQMSASVRGKVVLVTGGGGSIGSELCRQIASFIPKKLIILDIYENNAYDIQNELKHLYPYLQLEVRIASVRDAVKLDRLFAELRPQVIYHAAAHKHVPLMEGSPDEAVKNNIFGTLNTVQMADRYGAERFVMISTDKAVNPTNVMGATKRVCEMIVQSYNTYSDTEFVTVRFGNVLGSNGSVIPLFRKQIESGGPVTVTHPDIIRYFMTIPEAVSLVLQAGASAKGGEIFVLDMGKPVRILDLAENLIRLSGHVPNVDIPIHFTGLRPGEKLYEELLMDEEGLRQTDNKLIYIGSQIPVDEARFYTDLEVLKRTAEAGGDVLPLLEELVPTFRKPEEVNEEAARRVSVV